METAFDYVWNENKKMKEELGFITATYEQSEAAKKELVEEVDRKKLKLENYRISKPTTAKPSTMLISAKKKPLL